MRERTLGGAAVQTVGSASNVTERTESRFEPSAFGRPAFGIAGATAIATCYAVLFAHPLRAESLTREDGWIESIGALAFGLTGLVFVLLFVRDRRAAPSISGQVSAPLLLLGLLFLFGAGEEISWGQRVFAFDTPELLREANLQGEVNVHNLPLFHHGMERTGWRAWVSMDRLFALFWFGFCVVLPIGALVWRRAAALCERFGVPRVPLCLGLLFPVVYTTSKFLEHYFAGDLLEGRVLEVREAGYAVLFLLIALHLARDRFVSDT